MTPPKAADMAGWGEPAPATEKASPSARFAVPSQFRRPSLLRRFMRWVWRRG